MKVVVIGGGPAGMMSAIMAKEAGNEVILIEKMKSLGRKLLITGKGRCNITSSLPMEEFIKLITGKGRCNITSSLPMEEFIKNTPGNGKFLYSVFNNFSNKDIIKFLNKEGLEVKEERGNRIFPVTDKSQDVLDCFIKKLKKDKVEIHYNEKVEEILYDKKEDEKIVTGVRTSKGEIKADKVILATGGKSYPLTGSTGDGYCLAQKLGHTITNLKPSLVPIEIFEKSICKNLQGLSLRNVSIKIIDNENKKEIYSDFGEMLFTHFGVSGPITLSSSAHLVRYKNIDEKFKNKNIKIIVDFKPALSEEKLEARILRDFKEFKNKQFKNSLDKLLPQKLIPVIIKLSNINENKKVNEITKEERKQLVILLKNFTLTLEKLRPIEEAIITSGGINIKEINPKTMESKLVKNLYFAGEIIDVDSYTGGFNLQIAYSTGYVAGLS